jgi:hypothetical protein
VTFSSASRLGDTLADGTLSFHGQDGEPIDPVAVAAAFVAFMTRAPAAAGGRARRDACFAAAASGHGDFAAGRGRHPGRTRAVGDAAGGPASIANLTGLTSVADGLGTATAGGTIGKAATGAGFPEETARTLVLGLATTGRLGDSVILPAYRRASLSPGTSSPSEYST